MVAPDLKHPKAAQQVEVARARGIDEMSALAAHEANVEPYRLQHTNHHVVQMPGMQFESVRLMG